MLGVSLFIVILSVVAPEKKASSVKRTSLFCYVEKKSNNVDYRTQSPLNLCGRKLQLQLQLQNYMPTDDYRFLIL